MSTTHRATQVPLKLSASTGTPKRSQEEMVLAIAALEHALAAPVADAEFPRRMKILPDWVFAQIS
jgi:hypothetical protein